MKIMDLLNQEILQTLGWTIIHSLWQIALIGLLVKLLLILLREQNANLRYNIILAGLVAMVLSSGFTYIHLYDAPVAISSPIQENTTEDPNIILSTLVFASEPVLTNGQTFLERLAAFIRYNTHYITLLWFLGFFIFSVRLAGGYWILLRIKSKGTLVNAKIQKRTEFLRIKINLKRTVDVFESAMVKVPVTMGYLKPAILLPTGLLTSIPVNQLEAIIAHELAHIKRNDYLVNLLKSLMETIFFYHPVFWWLSNQLDNERENCCDDLTLSICANKKDFQQALLNIELHNQKLQQIAAALYKNKFQLLKRIKRMKTKNNLNPATRYRFTGLLVLPLALLIFGISTAFAPRLNNLTDFEIPLSIETVDETPKVEPVDESVPEEIVAPKPVDNLEPVTVVRPDTNLKMRYGSKIKTDDGYVLMEFDENMILQKISKNGKELEGEERAEYERIAKKSKQVFDAENANKASEAELAELEEKLKEVEKRMIEVQTEYSKIMKSYMEKSGKNFSTQWSNIYDDDFVDTDAFQWHAYTDLPNRFEFPEPPMPDFDFDSDEWKDRFADSREVYEKLIQEHKERENDFWHHNSQLHERLIAEELESMEEVERETREVERETRELERETQELERESRLLETKLRSELIRDGLINKWDEVEEFKLNNKRLELNGEKLSKKLHEKYLKLYEKITGDELKGSLMINAHID